MMPFGNYGVITDSMSRCRIPLKHFEAGHVFTEVQTLLCYCDEINVLIQPRADRSFSLACLHILINYGYQSWFSPEEQAVVVVTSNLPRSLLFFVAVE